MSHVTIYLNRDAFSVDRDAYLEVVELTDGDWIRVAEWVEAVGVYLGSKPTPGVFLPFAPHDPTPRHSGDRLAPEAQAYPDTDGQASQGPDGYSCVEPGDRHIGATDHSIAHLPQGQPEAHHLQETEGEIGAPRLAQGVVTHGWEPCALPRIL